MGWGRAVVPATPSSVYLPESDETFQLPWHCRYPTPCPNRPPVVASRGDIAATPLLPWLYCVQRLYIPLPDTAVRDGRKNAGTGDERDIVDGRGHNFTLVKKQSRLDVRKFSFSQRTINV